MSEYRILNRLENLQTGGGKGKFGQPTQLSLTLSNPQDVGNTRTWALSVDGASVVSGSYQSGQTASGQLQFKPGKHALTITVDGGSYSGSYSGNLVFSGILVNKQLTIPSITSSAGFSGNIVALPGGIILSFNALKNLPGFGRGGGTFGLATKPLLASIPTPLSKNLSVLIKATNPQDTTTSRTWQLSIDNGCGTNPPANSYCHKETHTSGQTMTVPLRKGLSLGKHSATFTIAGTYTGTYTGTLEVRSSLPAGLATGGGVQIPGLQRLNAIHRTTFKVTSANPTATVPFSVVPFAFSRVSPIIGGGKGGLQSIADIAGLGKRYPQTYGVPPFPPVNPSPTETSNPSTRVPLPANYIGTESVTDTEIVLPHLGPSSRPLSSVADLSAVR